MKRLFAVALLACAATTSAASAAPIAIDFEGYLANITTRPSNPAFAAAFPIGTTMRGTFVYEAGAAMGPLVTFTQPTYEIYLRQGGGPEVVTAGELTIGTGPGATTIRYEGPNPDLPPYYVDYFANRATQLSLSEGLNRDWNSADEQMSIALGTGSITFDGQRYNSSIFSESVDRTGAYSPVSMSLSAINAGTLDGSDPVFDRVGIVDLEVLPSDFDEFFTTAESTVLSLNFTDGGSVANFRFVITSVTSAAVVEVPEPAPLALLGVGVLALAGRRRRRG